MSLKIRNDLLLLNLETLIDALFKLKISYQCTLQVEKTDFFL